ncbi:hypothetical protein [Pseudomonas sp. TNT3]|uniref:hypothetical protein n=1 Tax=Pseudomonas sp. TNT3 TaxID=2654097 RepID=UPI001390ED84|nr:hypothetical protein [Pseudomonas sp. TNT3]KAI2693236.1 hypothetical protein GBC55_006810 [Pseudomonas sp. TNT3]
MTNEERAERILSSLYGPASKNMHDLFFGLKGTAVDSQLISEQLHQPNGELRPELDPAVSQKERCLAIAEELSKEPELKEMIYLQINGRILTEGLGL